MQSVWDWDSKCVLVIKVSSFQGASSLGYIHVQLYMMVVLLGPFHFEDEVVVAIAIQRVYRLLRILFYVVADKGKSLQKIRTITIRKGPCSVRGMVWG